jgi:DNA-directed RNA polymerase subunit N (RpoN/RPB10)
MEISKSTVDKEVTHSKKTSLSHNSRSVPNRLPYVLPHIDTLGYIQCVTCGKMIGNLYDKAEELRMNNFTELEIYERLGLRRTCCRYHLTLGIKMPMVKYLDENVRLDLVGVVEQDEENVVVNKETEEMSKDKDKVNGIKSRLAKLRDASNQVMGNISTRPIDVSSIVKDTNSKRISFFVAT